LPGNSFGVAFSHEELLSMENAVLKTVEEIQRGRPNRTTRASLGSTSRKVTLFAFGESWPNICGSLSKAWHA
jgi:hypothetical protein